MMGILISFILWYKIHLSTKDKLDLSVCSFLPSEVGTCWKCLDILNHNAVRKAIWDRLYIFISVVKSLRGWALQQDWTEVPAWGKGGMPFSSPVVPVHSHSLRWSLICPWCILWARAGTSSEGKIVCAPLLQFWNNGRIWGFEDVFMPLCFRVCQEEAGARMEFPAVVTSPMSYPGVAGLNTTFGPNFPKSFMWFVCSVRPGHAESVSCGGLLLMWLTNISLQWEHGQPNSKNK